MSRRVGLKIVLVILSSLRVDHLGLYGNTWLKTGTFDNLGKMGRVFTQVQSHELNPVGTRMEILTGLSIHRFSEPPRVQSGFTLPGHLQALGFRTALFTDNFPMCSLYESIKAFDTVYFVPGQGSDPHLPGMLSLAVDAGLGNSILGGSSRLPDESQQERYIRNRGFYSHLGHPAVRLFSAVREFIKNDDGEKSFLLVDSFGLQPPWDPPPEFARFRTAEDLSSIAWPVPGPIDPQDKNIQKQLNFLRRTYADNCLFLDEMVGKIPTDGIHLWIMSDQGVLIGDENFLLYEPGQRFPHLTKQVLLACGPETEKGSRGEDPIYPLDLFPTLLTLGGISHLPPNDGKIIQNLKS